MPLNCALDFGTHGAVHEVGGREPEHESACHLRRGNRQTAANGVAATIQTETIKKLGPMSVGGVAVVPTRTRLMGSGYHVAQDVLPLKSASI